jgi:hypothetical protein
MTMKGLDDVLGNVVYAQSIWKKMLSGKFRLDEFLSPYEFSDFGTVRDSIKNILDKVKIEDRTFEKPEILKWLGIVNNQVSYFTYDRNTIADLLSQRKSPSHWSVYYACADKCQYHFSLGTYISN